MTVVRAMNWSTKTSKFYLFLVILVFGYEITKFWLFHWLLLKSLVNFKIQDFQDILKKTKCRFTLKVFVLTTKYTV